MGADPIRKSQAGNVPTFMIAPKGPYDSYKPYDPGQDTYQAISAGQSSGGFTNQAVAHHDDYEQKVVQALVWTRQNGELAKRPHQAVWDEAWRLYNNEWDFSDKAEWQSQRALPKVTMAVERLTAVLERILSMSRQWFSVITKNPRKQLWVNVVRDLMDHWLGHEKLNFFLLFQDAIKVAFLSQIMCVEVSCEVDGIPDPEFEAPVLETQKAAGVPFTLFQDRGPVERGPNSEPEWFPLLKLWNPDRVTLDMTARDRFIVARYSYTKGEFMAEAKARSFDPDKVRLTVAGAYKAWEETSREYQKRQEPPGLDTDLVTLDYFWGDLYDMQGRCLFKNKFCILANNAHLVLKPTDNPFWHRKKPFICAGLIRVPFSVYNKSLIGISLDSFGMWVEFLNLLMDYFQALFLGQYEMNMANLHEDENPDELDWYPGKLWKKKRPEELVKLVQAGQADPQVWNFLSTLSQELQEGTAMMDAMAGQPRTRGQLSSMEFTRRMAEGGVYFDFIFRQLEDNWIRPLLKMLFCVILQYMPMKDWAEWVENHKSKYPPNSPVVAELDKIKFLTPRERFDLLANDMEFSTRVFSAIFDRQQEIEKITYMLGVLGRVPQASQYLKWSNILGKLIEAFGWDREEMISETPISFMGDDPLAGQPPGAPEEPPNPYGSDGGQGLNGQAAMPGSAHTNTAAGFLGGSAGGQTSGINQMMPGVRRSGNPQAGGSGG